jgi:hypothetical protein
MPRVSNREIEKYYFEMFRKDYPLPLGVVEYSDRPDVILHGERKIGVEICNLFLEDGSLPESEQIQRRARECAIAQAQRIYQQGDSQEFVLTFSFNKQASIRDAKELGRRIARFASSITHDEDGVLCKEAFSDVPELSYVYLNAKVWKDSNWRICQVYSTPFLSSGLLNKVIQEKETKAKGYQSCDAYWLLAIVDFMDRAQDQEIPSEGLSFVSGLFEKVIVYKTLLGRFIEFDCEL